MATEVLRPTSPAEAIAAFGDGGVTVLGGGTIVMPEISYGRLRPSKVLMLGQAGMAGVSRRDGVVRIGAATTVAELEDGDEPLASVARGVADPEIRAQATVGGNLCAPPAAVQRGDLQAALVALGARVRSTGPGGETSGTVEELLAGEPSARLVLELEYDDDAERRSGHAAVKRPHGHHYTILSVCCVRSAGETRVAIGGASAHAVRSPSVEQALAAGEPAAIAARKALDDVDPADDALASAWYRRHVLPTIVARALAGLEKESA